MDNNKEDYSEEFAQQLKKGRIFAFYSIGIFILIIAGLPIAYFSLELNQTGILIYMLLSLLLLVPAIPGLIALKKCPACKKFMGQTPTYFCPLCGVKIRK